MQILGVPPFRDVSPVIPQAPDSFELVEFIKHRCPFWIMWLTSPLFVETFLLVLVKTDDILVGPRVLR